MWKSSLFLLLHILFLSIAWTVLNIPLPPNSVFLARAAPDDENDENLCGFNIFCRLQASMQRRWGARKQRRQLKKDAAATFRAEMKARQSELYDYIIVGAGAAGCPLAATLAEAGYSTLLIERGGSTNKTNLDVFNAGMGITNPLLSQLVLTKGGIRTHVASAVGGGTTINLGVYVEEAQEYFASLEKFHGVKWHYPAVKEAYQWVRDRISGKLPSVNPYGGAWEQFLQNAGYEKYSVGPSGQASHSPEIQPGKYWKANTLFDQHNNYKRTTAETFLSGNQSGPLDNLTLLTHHIVTRVIFSSSIENIPTATCVEYKETDKEDLQEIGSMDSNLFDAVENSIHGAVNSVIGAINNPFARLSNFFKPRKTAAIHHVACIKQGGEIILSAGAIFSPALLFKSGVGPVNQIEELSLPLIKDIPNLGENLIDRAFINLGVFFDSAARRREKFPTICSHVGITTTGPSCDNYRIGNIDEGCSLMNAEEMSGGSISEGIIYASRFVFPPEWRNHPFANYLFQVLEDCSHSRFPYDNPLLQPLCRMAKPLIHCLRNSVANFYFTSEPKSRGSVRMSQSGEILVNPKYMEENQDLIDAIRGVSSLIRQVNGGVYKNIMEEKSKVSCPAQLLNGFLNIILEADLLVDRGKMPTNFRETSAQIKAELSLHSLGKNLKDIDAQLRTAEEARAARLEAFRKDLYMADSISKRYLTIPVKVGASVEESEDGSRLSEVTSGHASKEEYDITEVSAVDVEVISVDFAEPDGAALASTDAGAAKANFIAAKADDNGSPAVEREEGRPHPERVGYSYVNVEGYLKGLQLSQNNITLDADESMYRYIFGESAPNREQVRPRSSPQDDAFITKLKEAQEQFAQTHFRDSNLENNISIRESWGLDNSDQWASSFPITLPDPDDAFGIAEYILKYMSSIWHFSGTAQMGAVVDEEFRVKGVNGLSIVDASVLNQLTRLNPTATILMIGRYAGRLKVQNRDIAYSQPF